MLEVQRYLQSHSLESLTDELGIKVNAHDSDPLVILNYNQIESPKTDAIVRECRGLVLHAETFEVVALSFNRFFNWGEVVEEMESFDFSDFSVQSKEDGSLALLYHFDGEWRANTRGSFAQDNMQYQEFTWVDGICQALNIKSLSELDPVLNKQFTYVCEFVSPWNKIVRKYDRPALYLLTMFDPKTGEELATNQCDEFAHVSGMLRPITYEFSSIEEIQEFLQRQTEEDPTFEGVVLRDVNGARWKIKSPTYLGFHRLRGESDNLHNPKHLLPFVLSGEDDELLTYFPEVKEKFWEVKSEVLEHFSQLLCLWIDTKDIEDQKEFALTILGKSPFVSLLFQVRKEHGKEQRSEHLKKIWRESQDVIHKTIFKK